MTTHITHRSLQVAFGASVGEACLTGAFTTVLGWHLDILLQGWSAKQLPTLTVLIIASISFRGLKKCFACIVFPALYDFEQHGSYFCQLLEVAYHKNGTNKQGMMNNTSFNSEQ